MLTESCQGASVLSGGAGGSVGTREPASICAVCQGAVLAGMLSLRGRAGRDSPSEVQHGALVRHRHGQHHRAQPGSLSLAHRSQNRWDWRVVRDPYGKLELPELGICE